MKGKRLPREEFERIFSKVPRLCIDLVIKTNKGILFTKRAIEPFKGEWHLPGGSVFFNESLEDAAKRIAEREVRLKIKIKNFLGYIEFQHEIQNNYEKHSVSIVFLAEMISDEISLNDEAEEFMISEEIPENFCTPQKEFLIKHKELFEDSKLY